MGRAVGLTVKITGGNKRRIWTETLPALKRGAGGRFGLWKTLGLFCRGTYLDVDGVTVGFVCQCESVQTSQLSSRHINTSWSLWEQHHRKKSNAEAQQD